MQPNKMLRRTFLGAGAAALTALSGGLKAASADEWKLGIITDEAGMDDSAALQRFVPAYHLHWVEIREIALDGKPRYIYRDASPAQLREIKKQLDDAGVQLSVLDSAVYKIQLPGTVLGPAAAGEKNPGAGEYGRQLDDLKRAAEAAHTLGTRKVRIFAFLRVADPQQVMTRVVDELGKAIQVARGSDIELVLENELSCNVGTGAESGRLFAAISDRTLMHNWDPGNCVPLGENPFPDGWNHLDHSRISHMHLKDAIGHKWMPIGAGTIDFVGQFRALKQMNYSGTMSLETHYRNARNDRYTSSVESMDGLMRVLKQV
jgi:sugar phosphate isomerase/epimerase